MSMLHSAIEILYQISQFVMPIFIFILVFNAGMSEHPKTILTTLQKDWKYFLRLVLYNNIFLPGAIWLILQFLPLDPSIENAFIILFLVSGASIVIMFVQLTGEEIKYAVTSIILLTLTTILIVPLLLPLLIVGAEISPTDLISNMLTSILLPLGLGILLRLFSEETAHKLSPVLRKAQGITMNIAVYGMIPKLLPQLGELLGSGVIIATFVFLLLAFVGGYSLELNGPNKAKQWTASFASGQRNGAIAFSIIINNFSDPKLLLATAIISTIGTVLFVQIAKYIHKKQNVAIETQ